VLAPCPHQLPQLHPADVLECTGAKRTGFDGGLTLPDHGGPELVGNEDGARVGHAGEPAGHVDDRPVVVAVVHEDRSHGERHPNVREEIVVGVRLCQAETDVGGGGGRRHDEHRLVTDHLDHPAPEGHDGVVRKLLETGHHRGELLVAEVLAEHGEPDHVGEADRHDRTDPGVVAGAVEHGAPGGDLQMTAPDVFEQPCHGRDRDIRLAGELVGVEDAVTGGEQDRGGTGTRLRFRDPGHRGADHPGHLDRAVQVDQTHRHHALEEADRLEIHLGEGGIVLVHVDEAERAPEATSQVDGDVGPRRDLGLGQAFAGGDQHPVDHQEVDDVIVDGAVDLGVGAAEVA